MNFNKDKMPIFLLVCESLQLSVRAKKNDVDLLCLWIENVKIGEEKRDQSVRRLMWDNADCRYASTFLDASHLYKRVYP